MDVLKTVDTWFLVLLVVALTGFFVWAVQYLFNGLKRSIELLGTNFQSSIEKLEKSILELFNHRNGHESRLVALETKCNFMHGDNDITRQSGGRRLQDPAEPPKGGNHGMSTHEP